MEASEGSYPHVRPCMGGFCTLRDKCAHYVEPCNRHRPDERMCERGAEYVMFFQSRAYAGRPASAERTAA